MSSLPSSQGRVPDSQQQQPLRVQRFHIWVLQKARGQAASGWGLRALVAALCCWAQGRGDPARLTCSDTFSLAPGAPGRNWQCPALPKDGLPSHSPACRGGARQRPPARRAADIHPVAMPSCPQSSLAPPNSMLPILNLFQKSHN